MDHNSPKYDLEDRLLEYSVGVVRLVETLPATRSANHVGGQLLRSGTSPLFNHGEAQAAESANDFTHKMKICLKELRESKRALRLIGAVPLSSDTGTIDGLLAETIELIRIFHASIRTATANNRRAPGGSRPGVSRDAGGDPPPRLAAPPHPRRSPEPPES
jgi:four helix bundle protein